MTKLANRLVFLLLLSAAMGWGQTKADPRVLVRQAGATTGQELVWDGSKWAPQDEPTQQMVLNGGVTPELRLGDNAGTSGGAGSILLQGVRGITTFNSGGDLQIQLPTGTTGQVLKWNGTVWAAAADDVGTKVLREESFTATAAQTAFTIAYSAPAVSGTAVPLRVYRNGVRLFYVASGPTLGQFTYSGTGVTTAANAANDIITIEYLN